MAIEKVLSPEKWATKQLQNAQNAGASWEDGTQNPSTSPVEGMKKAKGRYKAEMLAAINEGRWDKAIDRLTDEFIAAAARAAGATAFTSGVSRSADRARAAITALQPKVLALKAKLDAMPTDTDAQREAKMIEAKRGMQQIGRELAGLAR